jgi:hypothetical protein
LEALFNEGILKRPIKRLPMVLVDREVIPALNPIISKYDPYWADAIVGSYRRKKDTFKDIDMILSISVEDFRSLGEELKNLSNFRLIMLGDDIIRGFLTIDTDSGLFDIELDINRFNTDSRAGIFLYRTGPAELNIFMRHIAMSYGYSLSEKGLLDHVTGEKVPVPQETEEDIFKALNIPFVPHDKREKWELYIPAGLLRSEANKRIRENILNGPDSICPDIANLIPNSVMAKIQLSKAVNKENAIVYYVKPIAQKVAAYPYKSEILQAYDIFLNKVLEKV